MSYRARTERENHRHDKAILRMAEVLEGRYDVWVDTSELSSDYPQPDTIHGKRPDILAKNYKEQILVEVETPSSDSTKRAKEQKRRFKNWASRKSDREFKLLYARQILEKY